MLRLTELRLPLDHSEAELRTAILRELGIESQELTGYSIFRRSSDARRKGAIDLVYHLDVETLREAEILRRLHGHPNVGPTPSGRSGRGVKVIRTRSCVPTVTPSSSVSVTVKLASASWRSLNGPPPITGKRKPRCTKYPLDSSDSENARVSTSNNTG